MGNAQDGEFLGQVAAGGLGIDRHGWHRDVGRLAGGQFTAQDGEAGVGSDADVDLLFGEGGDGDFNRARSKDFAYGGMGTDATGGDLNGLM